MPILCEKHAAVPRHQIIDDRYYRIGIGHSESTARAKVILDIDDDKGGVHASGAKKIVPRVDVPLRQASV